MHGILFTIYLIGSIIACVLSLVYVSKTEKETIREAKEEGIRHSQANSSIALGILFITVFSWLGVWLLTCKEPYKSVIFNKKQ